MILFGGGGRLELGHDLKNPVTALLRLVEFKMKPRCVFDVEGLIDLRLPLFP